MSLHHLHLWIKLARLLPDKPASFSLILKILSFQAKLDSWLAQSVEDFDYLQFKLALYLGANPNINACIGHEYPLVTRLARSGESIFLETLHIYGASVDARLPPNSFLPLHMAAIKGMSDSINILVKFGADIHARFSPSANNQSTTLGICAIISACKHNKLDALQALLAAGANPDDTDETHQSALNICIANNNLELANAIIRAGTQLNFPVKKLQYT